VNFTLLPVVLVLPLLVTRRPPGLRRTTGPTLAARMF
jgi:hypothetical protein